MEYYPIKFIPYLKKTIWGGERIKEYKQLSGVGHNIGESWELSQVEGHVSVISNGSLKGKDLNDLIALDPEGILGKKVYRRFGTKFPLLIKFLDAAKDLSVQVHPDDLFARAHHGADAMGKTEMAYVIEASKDATLIAGFSKQIDEAEYEKRIAEDTIEEVLLKHSAKSGHVYFIPPGRVHAYGGGLLLLEVQQSSDWTYRLYDYHRKGPDGKLRELHTDLAKKALDYKMYDRYYTEHDTHHQVVCVSDCPHFTTNMVSLKDNAIKRDLSKYDSFSVCVCIKGEVFLDCGNGITETLKRGETVLIPAVLAKQYALSSTGEASLMEIYIAHS